MNDLTLVNQTLPAGDTDARTYIYHIYPPKKSSLGRRSLVNDRSEAEQADGWVCDATALVLWSASQVAIAAKDAEIAALKAALKQAAKALTECNYADVGSYAGELSNSVLSVIATVIPASIATANRASGGIRC
tara:strand:+ start:8831 stop:9229 length:399 start_codon:yes stop_codon:yes gene_type:complete